MCINACGRRAAQGYPTCCRTCKGQGGHGPTCDAAYGIARQWDHGATVGALDPSDRAHDQKPKLYYTNHRYVVKYSQDTCVQWLRPSALEHMQHCSNRLEKMQEIVGHRPDSGVDPQRLWHMPCNNCKGKGEKQGAGSLESALCSHCLGYGLSTDSLPYSPLVISHPWLAPEHPDWNGDHLRQLLEWLRKPHWSGYKYCTTPSCKLGVAEMQTASWSELLSGLFIDYCSLPQRPRTDLEERDFRIALSSMDILYAHDCTYMLRIDLIPEVAESKTPYEDRGWCRFESYTSNLKAYPSRATAITVVPTLVPRLPDDFNLELARLHVTNGNTDKTLIGKLYATVFDDHAKVLTVCTVNRLSLDEARKLVRVLPRFQALKNLNFRNCAATLEVTGAEELAVVFRDSSKLQNLNSIGWELTSEFGDTSFDAPSEAMKILRNAAQTRNIMWRGPLLEPPRPRRSRSFQCVTQLFQAH